MTYNGICAVQIPAVEKFIKKQTLLDSGVNMPNTYFMKIVSINDWNGEQSLMLMKTIS